MEDDDELLGPQIAVADPAETRMERMSRALAAVRAAHPDLAKRHWQPVTVEKLADRHPDYYPVLWSLVKAEMERQPC